MSTEALAFVKMMELGEVESTSTRFVLYVIAENTFNDSFRCVLDQTQMAFEAGRMSVRSLRRQLDALSYDDKNPSKPVFITRSPRFDCSGKRIEDAIEIVGFEAWYIERTQNRRGRNRGEGVPDKLSGRGTAKSDAAGEGVPDKLSGRNRTECPGVPDTAMSGGTGQQESEHKEDRTSTRTSEVARERASDFNFDLEGKAVRDRLHHRFGGKVHDAWFARMAFSPGDGGVAVASTTDRVIRDWVRSKYEIAITEICRDVWPGTTSVAFRVEPQPATGAASP